MYGQGTTSGHIKVEDDVPDRHREEILFHIFAAGLESRVKLIHRPRIEVRTVTPSCQHKV